MNRPASQPHDANLNLFTAAAEPPVVSPRFWVQLLRYRPVILLGCLWLGLICVAAVAYSRLMFAGVSPAKLDAELSERTEIRPPLRGSRGVPQGDPAPTPAAQEGLAAPDPASSAPTNPDITNPESLATATTPSDVKDEGFSGSSLGVLVILCAGGCFLMHRRATAPARPRPTRSAGAPGRSSANGSSRFEKKRQRPGLQRRSQAAAKSAEPKRLQPYLADRDQIVVPPAGPLMSHAADPARVVTPAMPSGRLANPGSAPASPADAPTPAVAIVPEGETVELDWPEGSLAHSLDIRQRRSLSSFM